MLCHCLCLIKKRKEGREGGRKEGRKEGKEGGREEGRKVGGQTLSGAHTKWWQWMLLVWGWVTEAEAGLLWTPALLECFILKENEVINKTSANDLSLRAREGEGVFQPGPGPLKSPQPHRSTEPGGGRRKSLLHNLLSRQNPYKVQEPCTRAIGRTSSWPVLSRRTKLKLNPGKCQGRMWCLCTGSY